MPSKTPLTVPPTQRRSAPIVTIVQQNRTIGPGKPKKATQSPVGLPSSASPAAPSPKDFNIDISNSNEYLSASSKYEPQSSSQLDDCNRSISTAASVIKVDGKLHKIVAIQRKEVAATLSTSPNNSALAGYMSKNSSPIKCASSQNSPQLCRYKELSEDEDEEVSNISERDPQIVHRSQHLHGSGSLSDTFQPAASYSVTPAFGEGNEIDDDDTLLSMSKSYDLQPHTLPALALADTASKPSHPPSASLSSSLQISNSPPALQEMSDENLMMAVALYQAELNRRLLKGNDNVLQGNLQNGDQIIKEFSEMFRGMIGTGSGSTLTSEALQAMLQLQSDDSGSGTTEIYWQGPEKETGRASPDTVSTITASTQYTDATTAIHSQILVDMDREKYVSRDSDSPKRSQTTRVYSAPSTRHGTPAKHQTAGRQVPRSSRVLSQSRTREGEKPRSSSAGAHMRLGTSRSSTPRSRSRLGSNKTGTLSHLSSLPSRHNTAAGKHTHTHTFPNIRSKGAKLRSRSCEYHLEVDDAELSSIHSEDKHNLNCSKDKSQPRQYTRDLVDSDLPKYPNHSHIPQPGSLASDNMFASITSRMNTFFAPTVAVALNQNHHNPLVAAKDISVGLTSAVPTSIDKADTTGVTGRPMVIDLAAVTKSLASGKINFPISPPGDLNVIRSPKSAFDDRSIGSNSTTSFVDRLE